VTDATDGTPTNCYYCHAPLEGDKKVCSRCGRSQLRTCFCGHQIWYQDKVCPYCGVDWTRVRRRRHKSRHKRVDYKKMARYAGAGAVSAFLVTMLALFVVDVLAHYYVGHYKPPGAGGQVAAVAPPDIASADFGQRLGMAKMAVGLIVRRVGDKLGAIREELLFGLLVIALGAGAGSLYYLAREGLLRSRRRRKPRSTKEPSS